MLSPKSSFWVILILKAVTDKSTTLKIATGLHVLIIEFWNLRPLLFSTNVNSQIWNNFSASAHGIPYTIMEFGNKGVPQFNPLIGHRYKNARMKYSRLHSGWYHGVPASRVTLDSFIPDASKCPRFRCRDNWIVFLKVWTWNIHDVYRTLVQTHPVHRSLPLLVFHKPVLSLARPYFLTGAIIETRSQASLLTPPGFLYFMFVVKPLICSQFKLQQFSNYECYECTFSKLFFHWR